MRHMDMLPRGIVNAPSVEVLGQVGWGSEKPGPVKGLPTYVRRLEWEGL